MDRMSHIKVTVLGAAGGIGQPLSLLLKVFSSANELALYDMAESHCPVPGIACDLSHINTDCVVTAYAGPEELPQALSGASVVLLTAGMPRREGMTRDHLFEINARIVQTLATACATHCPTAFLAIITNPVNSMVPVASQVYEKLGVFDFRRLVGVTTLDCSRADKFVSEVLGCSSKSVSVPVIGGHAAESIMPLLSQVTGPDGKCLTEQQIHELDLRIQNAGNEKKTAGSATLSMAYAASEFCRCVVDGLRGQTTTAYCFVKSEVCGCAYFSQKCTFGECGICEIEKPEMKTSYERTRIEEVVKKLSEDIVKGLQFGHEQAC